MTELDIAVVIVAYKCAALTIGRRGAIRGWIPYTRVCSDHFVELSQLFQLDPRDSRYRSKDSRRFRPTALQV
jgi:hypothetical protein